MGVNRESAGESKKGRRRWYSYLASKENITGNGSRHPGAAVTSSEDTASPLDLEL